MGLPVAEKRMLFTCTLNKGIAKLLPAPLCATSLLEGMHPTKRNYFFDLTQATFAYKNNHGQE
jgi:hypothetical protein